MKKGIVAIHCPECKTKASFLFSDLRQNWDLQITCENCAHEFYAELALQQYVHDGMKALGYAVKPIIPHASQRHAQSEKATKARMVIDQGAVAGMVALSAN